MTKVMIIANDESTIFNFRREILKAFVREKYEILVCYPLGNHTEEIRTTGCKVVDIEVVRHGKNVFRDLKLLRNCRMLINMFNPDVVLTYTVKPNVYGSFACQMTKTHYINNVTGLGSVLQNESTLSKIILVLQKYAYRRSSCVFFQNRENCNRLRNAGVISKDTPVYILPGSGVNLEMQSYEEFPENDGIVRFVMVSRIRSDKGYSEFFNAAEFIKSNYPNTEFNVVGWYEEEGLRQRLEYLCDHGIIIYHGALAQTEVHDLIKKCNCLIHPSYHEGMANVLLEAAATGRPVIASNIPGCKETFEENVTGYECEAHDTDSLVRAIEKLIMTPYEEQVKMGRLGRKKMENEFDREFVADRYIEYIERIKKKV